MLELLAIACAGVFAGAAVYISVVQHPAALEAGGSVPVRFFSPMYRRAAPMQAGLAVVGTLAALLAWLFGSGFSWLLGALLLGFSVPFTLVRIKPINDRLQAPGLDPEDADVPGLLREWGRLHALRSLTSALAFVVFLLGQNP